MVDSVWAVSTIPRYVAPMSTKAIGYVRQSRRKDSEASPESQRESIKAHCQAQGWELVGFHEDIGVSGWDVSVQRPGLDAVLADVAAGRATKLVVRDLSRLSRRGIIEALSIVEKLETTGATLASVAEPFLDTSSPIGQAIFSLFAAFARQESDLRSEKVKEAKASLRKSSPKFQGGLPPFGFRVVKGKLAVHPKEGPVLLGVINAILAGGSVTGQCAVLNDAGIRGGRGAKWRATSLKRTLTSVYLAGWQPDGGERGVNRVVLGEDGLPLVVHEALISGGDYHRLQTIIHGRTGKAGRGVPSLLRGLVVCDVCGSTLTGDRSRDKGACRYRCSGVGCDLGVSMMHLNRYVAGWVALTLAALDPDEDVDRLVAIARLLVQEVAAADDGERKALQADLESVDKALEGLDDDRTDGLITGDRYKRQVERLSERRTLIVKSLEGLTPPPVDIGILMDPLMASDDGDPSEALLALPTAGAIIAAVVERVEVAPAPDRQRRFSPERVTIRPRVPE